LADLTGERVKAPGYQLSSLGN